MINLPDPPDSMTCDKIREDKSEAMTKQFHIGDILSITTGRLISPRLIEGIYDILNYMTGDTLFTHQLPRASRFCAPYLIRQFPQLKDADAEGITKDNWKEKLNGFVKQYGEFLDVETLPKGTYGHIEPISELETMVGKDKIIVVEV